MCEVDMETQSLSDLDGYRNISEYFYPQHEDYKYFVKRYIFEQWGSDGPSGLAQFWGEGLFDNDWIDQKMPGGSGGDGWIYEPWTKEICVDNGTMYLNGYSWQQPWAKWTWIIHKASSSEIVLISQNDTYFFRITKGDSISAAASYYEESTNDKYRR